MKQQVIGNPEKNRTNLKDSQFNSLVVISSLMVTCYLTANIMAVKLITIAGLTLFDAGTITFPLSYIIGDVLTEIWGYRISKKVILLTFVCNIILVFSTSIGIFLPSPSYMQDINICYKTIFKIIPRILIASLTAFLVGELTNAWVMEKIKIKTYGKHLWFRTILSSAIGYALDTIVFIFIAFYSNISTKDLITMIIAQYALKIMVEIVLGTPLSYIIINYLKRRAN